jgi:arsenite methyltransferase
MRPTDQAADSRADSASTVKQCCARLYESEVAKLLLGDSFHPGGLRLTQRLGELLAITPEARVLDVASGPGVSACFLAERFGCRATGIDYSSDAVDCANELARNKNLASRVQFQIGDAEHLDFDRASFDAIVCECAFCTFPDKPAAAREFARVLRPGGQIGISELTRSAVLPEELSNLFAWIFCIADAQPVRSYSDWLRSAGLQIDTVENHDDALIETVHQIRMKLLSVEVLVGLQKLVLPGIDFTSAKKMAASALAAAERGQLGYAIITTAK